MAYFGKFAKQMSNSPTPIWQVYIKMGFPHRTKLLLSLFSILTLSVLNFTQISGESSSNFFYSLNSISFPTNLLNTNVLGWKLNQVQVNPTELPQPELTRPVSNTGPWWVESMNIYENLFQVYQEDNCFKQRMSQNPLDTQMTQ